MFCPKCGNTIQDGAAFCPACGAKFGPSQPPPPAPGPVPNYNQAPGYGAPAYRPAPKPFTLFDIRKIDNALGMIGAILLFVGVALPFIRVEFWGEKLGITMQYIDSYADDANSYYWIFFIIGAAAILLLLINNDIGFAIASGVSAAAVIFEKLHIGNIMDEQMGDYGSDDMIKSDIGFYILIIAVALLVIAAVIKFVNKPRPQMPPMQQPPMY